MTSYLCQVGKYCGGRVCLVNDVNDRGGGGGSDDGGEGVPQGVSDVCEGLQSAPRPGEFR